MKIELWTSQEMIKMAKAVLEDVSYDELGNPTYSNPIFSESIFNEKTVHDMLVQGAKHYDDLKNKTLRNCDLFETEDEAKEAYEELFYGTFQLKNCKDTIVALKPGSPEFSTWLMSPVKVEEKKRLDVTKEERDAELKTVADVVRVMTGVGTDRGYYFNSEVREFGQKIDELHANELKELHQRLNAVKNIAQRENWRDEKDQGVRVNTCEKVHNVVMKDILRAANGEKVNA